MKQYLVRIERKRKKSNDVFIIRARNNLELEFIVDRICNDIIYDVIGYEYDLIPKAKTLPCYFVGSWKGVACIKFDLIEGKSKGNKNEK